jgi:DNA-binding PucR family transcriptional regulator
VHCDEHLVALVTSWEPGLTGLLAERRLAPLAGLGAAEREVLGATLLAWLRAQGQVLAAAAALPAHPQTVRYRMRKIRRLFGAALDDPDSRLGLQLALLHRYGRSS